VLSTFSFCCCNKKFAFFLWILCRHWINPNKTKKYVILRNRLLHRWSLYLHSSWLGRISNLFRIRCF
jgi:hypothetical protein